ncbi:MAG: hypothetical protein M3132_09865 [Actinomycetia bacterium]|nr:hypothetical protein [Actinomycetes bacterium]
MTRTALVIDCDEKRLRLVCDALVMFRPGFRVSTARDLQSAGDWLDTLSPDLVILDGSIAPADMLGDWADQHRLDATRTVILGPASPAVKALGAQSVPSPMILPEFMETVRTIARRSDQTTVGPMATMKGSVR